MGEELTLSEQFGLIALKNQRSRQKTTVKKANVRALAAACLLEVAIQEAFDEKLDAEVNIDQIKTLPSYVKDIIAMLTKESTIQKQDIKNILAQASTLSNKQLVEIEKLCLTHLTKNHLIREKNALLSCDLEFETAGIVVKEYVVNEAFYKKYMTAFRDNLLKDDLQSNMTVALLWLCKEAGALQELFLEEEIEEILSIYQQLSEHSAFAKLFYDLAIHQAKENKLKRFFQFKNTVMGTPAGSGVNFIFPMLERSQAVFIASEAYFAGRDKMFTALTDKLNTYNIHYDLVEVEGNVLLKIDGIYYEAIPFSKQYKMPVHGLQLRKYPVALQV